LLIREPSATWAAIERWLRAAAPIPYVTVHERNPSAAALAADWGRGVHTRVARVGAGGVSCHSAVEVDAALAAGATLALLSPVWSPSSKADERTPLGPDRFIAIAAGRPVLALGGLTAARHRRLRQRGGWGSAAIGGLFTAEHPAAAAAGLRDWLKPDDA
jgi:thiamine monophosphate synthase